MTDTDSARTDSDTARADSERPLRKDAARNRALLIAAGREVFAERGLDASLDDVAHAAGVGVGTAYRHFANKYELAQAIFGDAVEQFAVRAEKAAEADDPWSGIVQFLEGAAEAQTADRGLRQVLMGVHDADAMDRVNRRLSGPLNDLVARAKEAGVVRPDVAATDLGIVVMMLCSAADVLADDAPGQWRRYVPMLLAGLRSDEVPAEPPVSEELLRQAMTSHKQRMFRADR